MRRNNAIDIAKGICILLMILGHCYSQNNAVIVLIYGFHMPFFFIISGALYRNKLQNKPQSFRVGTQLRKLMVPYLISEILFGFMLCLLNHPDGLLMTMKSKAIQLVTLRGVTVTWFLPCMAVATISFFVLWKYKHWLAYGYAGACMIIGLMAAPGDGYSSVVYRTMVAVGYVAIGCAAPNVFSKIWKSGGFCLCGTILYTALALTNGMVSMVSAQFQNPLLYLLNGCLGSCVVVQWAGWLEGLAHFRVAEKICSVFRFFGRNTMTVLCTHMFFVEIIRLLDYKLFNNLLQKLGIAEGIVFCVIVSICEGILILCWTKVMKPKIKMLYGKTRTSVFVRP